VMDAMKMARVSVPGEESVQKTPIFSDVSLGDAP